jgi:hypothetical protein
MKKIIFKFLKAENFELSPKKRVNLKVKGDGKIKNNWTLVIKNTRVQMAT